MTYTCAVLGVSPVAYEEIRAKLLRAGYGHAFARSDGRIDMFGIALQADTGGDRQPTAAEVGVPAASQAFYDWVIANAARLGADEGEREFFQRLFVVRQRGGPQRDEAACPSCGTENALYTRCGNCGEEYHEEP